MLLYLSSRGVDARCAVAVHKLHECGNGRRLHQTSVFVCVCVCVCVCE